jgi:hypothetical protein
VVEEAIVITKTTVVVPKSEGTAEPRSVSEIGSIAESRSARKMRPASCEDSHTATRYGLCRER